MVDSPPLHMVEPRLSGQSTKQLGKPSPRYPNPVGGVVNGARFEKMIIQMSNVSRHLIDTGFLRKVDRRLFTGKIVTGEK